MLFVRSTDCLICTFTISSAMFIVISLQKVYRAYCPFTYYEKALIIPFRPYHLHDSVDCMLFIFNQYVLSVTEARNHTHARGRPHARTHNALFTTPSSLRNIVLIVRLSHKQNIGDCPFTTYKTFLFVRSPHIHNTVDCRYPL